MNYVDSEHRVTDIYIEKSWDRVDKLQQAVMQYVRNLDDNAARGNDIKPNELRKSLRIVNE